MRPGEKAKDFKGTLKKLVKYMRPSLFAIIVSLVFAAASVILTLNIPGLLGDSTDKLIEGFMQKQIYEQLDETVRDSEMPFDGLAALSRATGVKTVDELFEKMKEGGAITDEKIGEIRDKLGNYADGVFEMSLTEKPTIDVDAIIGLLTVISVLIFVSAAISYTQSFILAGVAQKTSYRLRRDIDEKINKLPLSYYDKTTNGNVLSYLTNDVDTVSTTLNQSLSQLVSSVTTIVGVLVMMIRISLIMSAVAVAIVPVSVILIMLVVKFSQVLPPPTSRACRRQRAHRGSVRG